MAADHPLSPGGVTHALLDTNALLPPRLSDVLFDLCLQGLFTAKWTLDIETEFLRNWPKVVARQRGATSAVSAKQAAIEQAKARRRLACFKGAVAEHEVFGYDNPAVPARVPSAVNPGDRHVIAAGLVMLNYAQELNVSDKVYIVSNNRHHLAAHEVARLGICVVSPGEFIDRLTQLDGTRVGFALERSVSSLENPPYTRQQLLDALLLHGAQKTVQHFASTWGQSLPRNA